MKILVVEPLAAEGLTLLRQHHDVDEKLGLPRDEIIAIVGGYDALVVRSQVKVDAEMIAAGTRLVVVGRAGVGVDNVDLEAATRAGIIVVNAPTGNTIAAAELTIALLFGLARKIAAADASMRRGEWKRSQFTGHELRGKTLGIVGLGKIGQAIAMRARAMQMTVIGSDPFVTPEQAAKMGVELVSFEEVVTRADAITVHVPKTKATTGLINKAVMERMKPGVLLLNVARGGVIDEADLADALRAGHVKGAWLQDLLRDPRRHIRQRPPFLRAGQVRSAPVAQAIQRWCGRRRALSGNEVTAAAALLSKEQLTLLGQFGLHIARKRLPRQHAGVGHPLLRGVGDDV